MLKHIKYWFDSINYLIVIVLLQVNKQSGRILKKQYLPKLFWHTLIRGKTGQVGVRTT